MTVEENTTLTIISRLAAPLAILALLPFGVALASDLPSRKAGLWVVKSQDNAFANWSACIDDSKDDFVNSDVWSDFGKECKLTSITKTAEGQTLLSECVMASTGKVKLRVDFSGDFQSEYRFQSTTEFTGADGKAERQSFSIQATYAGQCPAGLKPGQKKMAR